MVVRWIGSYSKTIYILIKPSFLPTCLSTYLQKGIPLPPEEVLNDEIQKLATKLTTYFQVGRSVGRLVSREIDR